MYEVEAIVGKRINSSTNALEYLVKWVNYPSQHNTWQPQRNLEFVKNLIDDFNKEAQIKGGFGLLAPDEAIKPKGTEETKSKRKKIIEDSDGDEDQAAIYFEEDQQEGQGKLNPRVTLDDRQLEKLQSQINKTQFRTGRALKVPTGQQTKAIIEKQGQKKQIKRKECQMPGKETVKLEGVSETLVKEKREETYPSRRYSSKAPPPLPPDFETHKAKYIDPSRINLTTNPVKRKLIEKDRHKRALLNKEQSFKTAQLQQQVVCSRSQASSQFRAADSPIFSKQSTPFVQENCYLKEQQIYKRFREQAVKTASKDSSLSLNRAVMPLKSPQGLIQNGPRYIPSNPNQQMLWRNRNLDGARTLQIFEVTSMERNQLGFIYLAESNEGPIWVTRNQLVPKFSVVLLQFYEKHLKFQ